jgi:hypothetical protein
MWEKPIKKQIYLLNVNNFAPRVTQITYPLIYHYADKIGADVHMITERKWPDAPPVYEKLQIYELAQKFGADWNIYIDSDTLINPDCFDFTAHIPMDTVAHNGKDMATHRWRYDRFFRRDGRHIGSCNWWAMASSWCIELWKPLDDLTVEEAISRIYPVVGELNSGECESSHLIDDFTLSRNIAKYGLKHTTLIDVCQRVGYSGNGFLIHMYNCSEDVKIKEYKKVLVQWGVAQWADFKDLITEDEVKCIQQEIQRKQMLQQQQAS